ncbi:MAG: ABC transporter permease [Candidatus Aminicenantes bacterium]|nr:ABC transporter permease [Candidatus Aminicenantes bacterium]
MIRLNKKNLQFRLGIMILAGLGMALAGLAFLQGISLQLHIEQRLRSPSAAHIFGTDALGRDMLSCLLFGTLVSLAIGLAAVFIAAAIGAGLGFLAGWHGGLFNICIMRGADFILAFPGILLALALIAFWGQGVINLVFALVVSGWVGYARLVRGEVLKIKDQEFIVAARGFNASSWQIARGHMLPLIFPLLLTQAVSGIAAVIMAESSLNFLGLGLDPRLPTLGGMIDAGRGHLFDKPAMVILPGACLSLLIAGILLLAEGLKMGPGTIAFEKNKK